MPMFRVTEIIQYDVDAESADEAVEKSGNPSFRKRVTIADHYAEPLDSDGNIL